MLLSASMPYVLMCMIVLDGVLFMGCMARPLKWKYGDMPCVSAVSGSRVKRGQSDGLA